MRQLDASVTAEHLGGGVRLLIEVSTGELLSVELSPHRAEAVREAIAVAMAAPVVAQPEMPVESSSEPQPAATPEADHLE